MQAYLDGKRTIIRLAHDVATQATVCSLLHSEHRELRRAPRTRRQGTAVPRHHALLKLGTGAGNK